MSKKQKITKRDYIKMIIILSIFCCLVVLSLPFSSQIEKVVNYAYNPKLTFSVSECNLKVHFLYVGQGECIAIQLPDGKNMIIDAGLKEYENEIINYLDNKFFPLTENKKIDYFIITHPHEDHIGGASAIIDRYEIKNCFRPKVYASGVESQLCNWNVSEDDLYIETITKLNNEKYNNMPCVIDYNDASKRIIGEDYTIKYLTPNLEIYENLNNYSPILLLTYKGTEIMFTGDAEKLIEDEVIDSYDELDIDILNIGHHGSSTSTSLEFLNLTTPESVVISCGQQNEYGHPSDIVLGRLQESGINENEIFRTDLCGNIVFGVDNESNIFCSVDYTKSFYFYYNHSYFIFVVVCCYCTSIIVFSSKIKQN